MNTAFTYTHIFNAPIGTLWHVLTDKYRMKEWYFHQILEFEPVVGFKFRFTDDASPYKKEWKVTKVVNGRLFAHTWAYKGYPGRSEVTFELFAEGNKAKLLITHTGIDSFPADPHFARQRFVDGWERIIGINLKQAVEKDNA